jgi:DNA-binding MarR family transcriptional regulator
MFRMTRSSKTSPVTAKVASDPLDGFLCFGVYSTGLAFNRVYKSKLDELGLTYPQYLVMLALWQDNDQTVGEIGEMLFLESNTLTPLIKRLEAVGFVKRQRDTADERVVRVSLTDKGREVASQAACLPEQILKVMGISQEEMANLQRSLVAIREKLRAAAAGS